MRLQLVSLFHVKPQSNQMPKGEKTYFQIWSKLFHFANSLLNTLLHLRRRCFLRFFFSALCSAHAYKYSVAHNKWEPDALFTPFIDSFQDKEQGNQEIPFFSFLLRSHEYDGSNNSVWNFYFCFIFNNATLLITQQKFTFYRIRFSEISSILICIIE